MRRPFGLVLGLAAAAAAVVAIAAGPLSAQDQAAPASALIAEDTSSLLVGAAEDAAKVGTYAEAKAKMDLARVAGFNAIRVTSLWTPGLTGVGGGELVGLRNAVAAADAGGIRVILSVYPTGSSVTPTTPQRQAEFARYAASLVAALPTVKRFIIGNEPNLNRFWMPQYGLRGEDVAAISYTSLLAQTYDAIKAVAQDAVVIGGSVSPRGADDPNAKRHTHSPTAFIADMGEAYRAMGRTRPLMDAFAFHPYQDNSSLPPSFAHPRSTTIALGDYGKLVAVLGRAFDGTGQPGTTLPVYYDEFGVESEIPTAKGAVYEGAEPAATRAVGEARQGAYYREALRLAACQPTVAGLLLFHVTDEPQLDRWQSGVFYADDTPKASLRLVQGAVVALREGTLAPCVLDRMTHRWVR